MMATLVVLGIAGGAWGGVTFARRRTTGRALSTD
jgi:hypothetical protein